MSMELTHVLAGAAQRECGRGAGTGQDFRETLGLGRGGALQCFPEMLDTCLVFSFQVQVFPPLNFVLLNIPVSLSTMSSLSLGFDP